MYYRPYQAKQKTQEPSKCMSDQGQLYIYDLLLKQELHCFELFGWFLEFNYDGSI